MQTIPSIATTPDCPSTPQPTPQPTMDNEENAAALWNACHAARDVCRRPQLFLWLQSHLRRLVPHDLAVCAAVRPGPMPLAFHVFHGVPLPPGSLSALADGSGPLVRQLVAQWLGNGEAAVVDLHQGDAASEPHRLALYRHGFAELMVHGVASLHEQHSLDSMIVVGSRTHRFGPDDLQALDMLLPLLHLMSLRVSAADGTRVPLRMRALPVSGPRGGSGTLTLRERQILLHVREGKRNAEIGQTLGISALTVKNHLQNILRKLGASNRAQAVAEALSKNLLSGSAA
jgi:transcriptional regulator EpsA